MGGDVEPTLTRPASHTAVDAEKLGKHHDVGLEIFEEALGMDPDVRQRLARRIRMKLDFGLLPVMCFIYLMSFLDKQTLNYGNAYDLQDDLHFAGDSYSWVASIINFGILVSSYPSTLALQRFHIGKIVGIALMCWGILNMASAAARSFPHLMAIRFLLGLFESCVGPAWMLMTSVFWTRREQPLRMCFWLGSNGIALLIGAGVSWGLGHHTGTSLAPWQLIFLTIGSFTFGLGVAAFFLLPSGPHDAWFLTHDEKLVAVWRVSENQTGIKNPKIQLYQAKEALLEPRVWFLAIQQLSIGIINGSITNFQSALLKGFGFSSSRTILYQLPNGAFQIICTVACGAIATYVPNSLILTTAASLLPPFAGMIGVHLISLDHQLALAACCWLFAVVGAAIILNWSVVASNFAGHTKRMTVNGLNFVFYYGGNIIGPFLFIPAEAPRYPTALKALIGMFVCLIVSTLAIGALMVMENRRRDGIAAAAGESRHESSLQVAGADGFMDHTDKEMGTFRYRV